MLSEFYQKPTKSISFLDLFNCKISKRVLEKGRVGGSRYWQQGEKGGPRDARMQGFGKASAAGMLVRESGDRKLASGLQGGMWG